MSSHHTGETVSSVRKGRKGKGGGGRGCVQPSELRVGWQVCEGVDLRGCGDEGVAR